MNAYHAVELNPVELAIIDFTNAMYDPNVFDFISKEEIRDALSSGQLLSKKWLVDRFIHKLGFEWVYSDDPKVPVLVVGGWVGLLAQSLNHAREAFIVDSLDISVKATKVASRVMAGGKGRAILGDMYDFDYSNYQVIVNTSAEHIPDVTAWSNKIPLGTSVVVQSNNARNIFEHVSCVDSAEELVDLLDLTEVHFAGYITFPMYTRFMVIGKK